MQFNRKTQKVNSNVEKEEQPGRRVNDPSSRNKTTTTNDNKTNDGQNKEFVLETNAHMRMSTFGIDPNFRKTIQVSREGIRSGSPINTNVRTFYDSNDKNDLSISEKKSDYKEHERMSGVKVTEYRSTVIGGKTNFEGSNSGLNLQGINSGVYMQGTHSGVNMTGTVTGGNLNSANTYIAGYTTIPIYATRETVTGSGAINPLQVLTLE
jgi:hypothetical protein